MTGKDPRFKQGAIKFARIVHENSLQPQCETCAHWHCLLEGTDKKASDQPPELFWGECHRHQYARDEHPRTQWQMTCPMYENLWVRSVKPVEKEGNVR